MAIVRMEKEYKSYEAAFAAACLKMDERYGWRVATLERSDDWLAFCQRVEAEAKAYLAESYEPYEYVGPTGGFEEAADTIRTGYRRIEPISGRTLTGSFVAVVNVTPHAIRFATGKNAFGEITTEEIPPCGTVVSATVSEEAGDIPAFLSKRNVEVVRPTFRQQEAALAFLKKCHAAGILPVGSIIAAQAYPGLVAAMVPLEGYERRPPEEKIMRPDKFSMYPA